MTSFLTTTNNARILPMQEAQPLLQREVEIFYKDGKAKSSLACSVYEIYLACQKRLKEFGALGLSLKGSAVSHLFSREPYHDIDMHSVIDLTALSDQEKLAKGYSIKWAILSGISEVISRKAARSQVSDAARPISSESILFEEDNFIFGFRSALPFNIHTVRLGQPMVEFTCKALVRPFDQPIRSYDFNSGALQIDIEDSGNIILTSLTPDLQTTLEQVKEKKLFVIEPEKIEKKALERYFAKLLISGYTDLSQDLLPFLISEQKKRRVKDLDSDIHTFLLSSILDHFNTKKLPPFAVCVALWLYKSDCDDLKALAKLCREGICTSSPSLRFIHPTLIKQMVEKRHKAKLCWYLLLQATDINITEHRQERSIQLSLPISPLFDDASDMGSIYVTFPIHYLAQVQEDSDLSLFFNALPASERDDLALSIATRDQLKTLFADHLTKKELFPILSAVFERFELKTTRAVVRLFFQWAESNEPNILSTLPKRWQASMVEAVSIEDINSSKKASLALLLISFVVPEEELYSFNQSRADRIVTALLSKLLKSGLDKSAESSLLIRRLISHMSCRFFQESERGGEGSLSYKKEMISIIHASYLQSVASKEELLATVALSIKEMRYDVAIKLLHSLVKKEEKISASFINETLLQLAISCPEEIINYLSDNLELWKKKAEIDFFPFCKVLFSRYVFHGDVLPLIFFSFGSHLLSDSEREQIAIELFHQKGYVQQKESIMLLVKNWQLSLSCFMAIEDLSQNELDLLWSLDKKTEHPAAHLSLFDMENLFTACINKGHTELSLEIAAYLAKNHPASFQEDGPVSQVWQQLPALNALIIAKELCLQIKSRGEFQKYLAIYLYLFDALKRHPDLLQKDDTIALIQTLHRSVFLYIPEHPLWASFWSICQGKTSDKSMESWIELDRFREILFDGSNLQAIYPLFDFCSVEPRFIFYLVEILADTPIEQRHKDLLLTLFTKSQNVVWHGLRQSIRVPQTHIDLLVNLLSDYLTAPIQKLEDIRNLDAAFDGLGLCAWYADGKARDLIMNNVLQMLVLGKQAKQFIILSGKSDLILMHCIERALEEKKWDELAVYNSVYSEFISIEGRRSSLTRKVMGLITESEERLSKRSKLWHSAIIDIGKSQLKVPVDNGHDRNLISLYIHYLSDVIVTLNQEINPLEISCESSVDIARTQNYQKLQRQKQFVIGQFFGCIDILIKRRRIDCIDSVPHFINIAMNLQAEDMLILFEKSFILSGEILHYFDKNPHPVDPWTSVSILLNQAVIFLSILENSKNLKLDGRHISRLLQTVIPFMGRQCPSVMLDSQAIYMISFLEGSLSLELINEHLFQWSRSIYERKQTVTFEELCLFSIYLLRLDKNISRSLASGININMFEAKFIVDDAFFNKAQTIEMLLSLFEIGFTRFPEKIGTEWDMKALAKVDIFAVFSLYILQIQKALVQAKEKSELYRLQTSLINLLEYPITLERNRISLLLVRTMLNFILMADQTGKITFRFKGKEQVARLVKIYFHCIRHITGQKKEFLEFNFNLALLQAVFDSHKDTFQRTLSKLEFVQISKNIKGLTSSDDITFLPLSPSSTEESGSEASPVSPDATISQLPEEEAAKAPSLVSDNLEGLIDTVFESQHGAIQHIENELMFYLNRDYTVEEEVDLVTLYFDGSAEDPYNRLPSK